MTEGGFLRTVTRRQAAALAFGSLAGARRASAAPILRPLTFSYQRSSALFIVLMANGELARRLAPAGYRPQFAEFERILDAMSADAVTFHGDVADSVPIFAEAAGAPLSYYAMEQGSPAAEALIVAAASPIRDVAGLRGRSVAVSKGSGAHYMLLGLLRRAGLRLADVRISFFEASDGSAAFASGAVDAWATWDPFLAITEARMAVRVLGDGSGITSYNRYYMVDAAFARANPHVVAIVFDALRDASASIRADPAASAALLSPLWGHASVALVERIDRRRGYRVGPVTPAAIDEQQRIADTFVAAGLIPDAIHVDAMPVWHPDAA